MERVGVFTCTGCGIGEALDIEALNAAAEDPKPTCTATHPCLCAPEGMDSVRKAVDEEKLEGVILAACSSRAKQQELQLDRADDDGRAREPARAGRVVPPAQRRRHPDARRGSGADGDGQGHAGEARDPDLRDRWRTGCWSSAAEWPASRPPAAPPGSDTRWFWSRRRTPSGDARRTSRYQTPGRPPYDTLVPNGLPDLVAAVQADAQIKVLTQARVKAIKGQPGQFSVEVETPIRGGELQVRGHRPGHRRATLRRHEARATWATARPRTSSPPTSWRRCSRGASWGGRRTARSRIGWSSSSARARGTPSTCAYCSSECCGVTLRQMAAIHKDHPRSRPPPSTRTCGPAASSSASTRRSRPSPGACSPAARSSAVEGNGILKVHLKESLLGDDVSLDADLVVLAVGMVPNSADGEAIRTLPRRPEAGGEGRLGDPEEGSPEGGRTSSSTTRAPRS